MVASGIAPAVAMLISIVVFAGASMVAAAQLLASNTPALLVVLTTLFINLRFMMYSASLRLHFGREPLGWRLLMAYLQADNVYGLTVMRYADKPDTPGERDFFMGAAIVVWVAWQLAVAAGILIGAGVPTAFRLEFAAPLARRALRYVPAAVLTAIWAPELFLAGDAIAVSLTNERLLAGAVAIAVAWRWRLTLATILAGLAALHLFHWLL